MMDVWIFIATRGWPGLLCCCFFVALMCIYIYKKIHVINFTAPSWWDFFAYLAQEIGMHEKKHAHNRQPPPHRNRHNVPQTWFKDVNAGCEACVFILGHDMTYMFCVCFVKEGVKTENDHINLKVAGQDGSVVQFKIKRHTPLSKLMKAYCERQVRASRHLFLCVHCRMTKIVSLPGGKYCPWLSFLVC